MPSNKRLLALRRVGPNVWTDGKRKYYFADDPGQSVSTSSDVEFSTVQTSILYFGDKSTNGSWRIVIKGTNLNFERRESGVWVRKGDVRP